jgi:phage/plasmid-like protein (TIGR03299 family)
MVANIEVVGEMATFASRREPAWHGLGTVINAESLTYLEILEEAHMLGWNVRLLSKQESAPTLTFDKDEYFVVRNNPFIKDQVDVLGEVSQRYNVFSNENTFAFGDALVNAGDVRGETMSWETAGAINGGRTIFGSLALEREIRIDSNGVDDVVKMFLLVASSHDGTSKLTVLVTPVRVVCQNTLNLAIRGAVQQFKIKHTQSMDGKVTEARDTLNLTDKYINVFEEKAANFFEKNVSNQEFWKIVEAIHGEKPEDNVKGRETRWQTKVDKAMELWTADTQQGITGNAWGALNTLTEQHQWFRGVRKDNSENFFSAGAGFDNVANVERNRIFSTVEAFVNA